MNDLRLADPLWLLAIVAVVTVVIWRARRRPGAVRFSSSALFSGAPHTFAQRIARLLPFARIAALSLLALALARPQRGLEEYRVRTEGIAIVMALDRSGSMIALDFEIDGQRTSRLDVVKRVFRRFVEGGDQLAGRPDDLIGLVSFGGYPEERCPLTLDHGALLQTLDGVQIPEPWVDAQGQPVNNELYEESMSTAIGDAIALAAERVKESPVKSKVVILLSDGEQTAGLLDPIDAANAAKELGVKIHTIGVGTTGVAPFPVRDRFGNVGYERRQVRLDETTLKAVAEATGGRYWNAQDTDTLGRVYEEIDRLEKTELEGAVYTDWIELYRWVLAPAAALLLAELLLAATRLRTVP